MTAFLVVLYLVAFAAAVFTAIAESRRKDHYIRLCLQALNSSKAHQTALRQSEDFAEALGNLVTQYSGLHRTDLESNARLQARNAVLTEQRDELSQKLKETKVLLKKFKEHNVALTVNLEATKVLAATDPLTGFPNRREFEERFSLWVNHAQRRVEKTGQHPSFCALMVDIDHFKEVNDTYGHPTGDKALVAIAYALKGCLRTDDIAARYGGEEFAIILADTEHACGLHAAERIRKTIADLRIRTESGVVISLTVSIGFSYCSLGESLLSEKVLAKWMEIADNALYHAKKQGRNRVVPATVLNREGFTTSTSPLKIVK